MTCYCSPNDFNVARRCFSTCSKKYGVCPDACTAVGTSRDKNICFLNLRASLWLTARELSESLERNTGTPSTGVETCLDGMAQAKSLAKYPPCIACATSASTDRESKTESRSFIRSSVSVLPTASGGGVCSKSGLSIVPPTQMR